MGAMRVSDSERQRTVEELRRHCAAGRLDVDEFSIRVEKAMGSSTLEDLDGLLADLPMIRIADPVGLPQRPSQVYPHGGSDEEVVAKRVTASITVLLTVVVVVAAIGIALFSSWGWSLVLLAGWLTGLAQGGLAGRASRRPRR